MSNQQLIAALSKLPRGAKIVVGDASEVIVGVEVIDGVIVIETMEDPDP